LTPSARYVQMSQFYKKERIDAINSSSIYARIAASRWDSLIVSGPMYHFVSLV
jgi:hypothetical protein